jgi:hypothetical protein
MPLPNIENAAISEKHVIQLSNQPTHGRFQVLFPQMHNRFACAKRPAFQFRRIGIIIRHSLRASVAPLSSPPTARSPTQPIKKRTAARHGFC